MNKSPAPGDRAMAAGVTPDPAARRLVVIYRRMRVNEPRGLATLMSFGPKIRKSVEAQPDVLLLHENLLFSLFRLIHRVIADCR